MAIDQGNESLTLAKSDRARRIEIWIDDADSVMLKIEREVIYKLNGVIQYRRGVTTTERTQNQIAAKSYTAGGVTRTGNQILMLLNKLADDERTVDIG